MQAKRETIFMRERAGHNADLTYAQWRTWDEERLELVFAAAALGE